MKKNKAQAAIEFLTTYGWAMLVVIVMIGALTYFGVLDPYRIVPEKCLFSSGIGCKDFAGSAGSHMVFAKLTNAMGYPIIIQSVSVSSTGTSTDAVACSDVTSGDFGCHLAAKEDGGSEPEWKSNGEKELQIDFTEGGLAVGDRPTIDVEIVYRKAGSSYDKKATGTIQVKPN